MRQGLNLLKARQIDYSNQIDDLENEFASLENDLIEGIKFSQLYKNWGDEYWSVRTTE